MVRSYEQYEQKIRISLAHNVWIASPCEPLRMPIVVSQRYNMTPVVYYHHSSDCIVYSNVVLEYLEVHADSLSS